MAWFSKEKSEAPKPVEATERSGGFFEGLKKSLSKTRDFLNTPIEELFSQNKPVDEAFLEKLEETLITADIGVPTAMRLMDRLRQILDTQDVSSAEDLKKALAQEVLDLVARSCAKPDTAIAAKPRVIMVVGVNGVGKTTTIGKLAALMASEGQKVLVVAADTFRAAAVEQLEIWAQRAGVQIVRHPGNADPAAVVFDGIEAGVARGMDIVIIDTAGRLHTKINLMEELKKIKRSAAKKLPGSPHEVWLVIDAATGQNAISQAKLFHEALGLTGIVLAKLDGTAKGGIVLAISNELDIPIRFVGTGEKLNDITRFDPNAFVNALF